MSNYINTKDLELEVSHYLQCEKESEVITLEELKEITSRLPSADVVEVKHGEWINKRTMVHDGEFYCSACDFVLDTFMQAVFYNYCPNCGADMRGDKDTNVLNNGERNMAE